MARVFKMKETKKVRKQVVTERTRTHEKGKRLRSSEDERRSAEKEIKEREQRFAEVADLLPQTLFECDRNGRITFINRGFLDAFGYTRKDFHKGLNVLKMVIPEDADRVREGLDRILGGKEIREVEFTALRKDGSPFPVLAFASPIRRENMPVGCRGFVVNITRRKRAEEALRESEERYRTLMDNAGDPILIADPEGNFVEANKAAEALFGYTKEELLRMNVTQIHPQDELEEVTRSFREMREGGLRAGRGIRVLRKDGTVVPADVTGSSVRYAGKTVMQGIFRDISERQRTEERLAESRDHLERLVAERTVELARSEKKYRDLVDNALVAIFKTNLGGDYLYVNETLVKLFEFESLEEFLSTPVVRAYKNPEERTAFIAQLRKEGKVLNYELELITRKGKNKSVLMNAILEGDEISGMMLDITDRKESERELKRKSASLEELNTALRVLLEQREKDKNGLEDKIFQNVKELVLPYIDSLKQRRLDEEQKMYLGILEKNLNNIISPFIQKMRALYAHFTPTEIKVADLIRDGKTAKEIAAMFGVAETSINTHKQRIREKLGLAHQKTNLKTYLMSLK